VLGHAAPPAGLSKPLLPRAIWSPALTLTSARMIGPGFAELRYDVPKPASVTR
jgi:hypothetical protein